MFISLGLFLVSLHNPVGNCSSPAGKVVGPNGPVFIAPDDPSCLPAGSGAKVASHNQGRVRNVAGDRGRRFYWIERRGRVERGGPCRPDRLRPSPPSPPMAQSPPPA